MIYLIQYDSDDLDIFENNPVEYMNRNDIDIYGIDRRSSMMSILILLANNGYF